MFNNIIVSMLNEELRSTGVATASDPVITKVSTLLLNSEEFTILSNELLDNSGIQYAGAVSMDGLFVPYTTDYGHTGILPRFERPTDTGNINVYDLNPFNPDNLYGSGTFSASGWKTSGHNISSALIINQSSTKATLDAKTHPVSTHFDSDFSFRQKTEVNKVQSIALRAPLVLSGYGYDIDGNPVPTGSDGNLHSEAPWNSALWKTGPLDVRWDAARGVWAASGGTVEIMDFTVDSPTESIGATSAACNSVRVTVTDIGHTTTSVAIGDTGVIVFDEDLCFFNLPLSLLVGLKGKARAYTNIYSDQVVDDCLTSGVVAAPFRWKVIGLGCGEEITNG